LTKDDVFYTRTMAKVYADQGNLKKAEKIYKYLLFHEPGQKDLIEALSEIEKQQVDRLPDEMVELFNQWIELLLLYRNYKMLSKFKKFLKNGR
jgi:TRAP-type mannitol/chloroaromatic compound transport system substrate-binding protein